MGTKTAARASRTFPVKDGHVGNVLFAYGVYTLAANPSQNDIIEMCILPKGAVVIDGFVRATDIDTGTEALDIDVGFTNNVDTPDSDAFGNLGVWSGDAVTDIKPEVCIYYPFNGVLKNGPLQLNDETVIQLLVNAAANAGGTGTIYVGVYYVMGG